MNKWPMERIKATIGYIRADEKRIEEHEKNIRRYETAIAVTELKIVRTKEGKEKMIAELKEQGIYY